MPYTNLILRLLALLNILMLLCVSLTLRLERAFGRPDILAYTSDYKLFLLDISQHRRMPIAENLLVEGLPHWSPDGSQIAFVSRVENYEIFAVNMDGSNLRRLTNNAVDDLTPTWTLNGEHIIFQSFGVAGDWRIINADGSDEQPYVMDSIPLFQYDNWSERHQRRLAATVQGLSSEIILYTLDSREQPLTHNQAGDLFPVWSPDFEQIAFVSDRDGNYELYLMDANCPQLPEICNNPQWRLSVDTANDNWPAWKPR